MALDKIMNGQLGKTKMQIVDDGYTDVGIYVWQKANGKYFTDGEGNVLNIPARKGDEAKKKELADAAAHYGEPDGSAIFFPGTARVSDETFSEQKDRMSQGLIPSETDIGAWAAAQKTFDTFGAEAFDE